VRNSGRRRDHQGHHPHRDGRGLDIPALPAGKVCGQLLTLESLIVPWCGTSRPGYGDVLDLFGRTITASITPVGYVKTGYCPIDWC